MSRSVVFGLLLAVTFVVMRVIVTTDAAGPPWDARPFDRPTNGLERALLLHDGQTYAALAQDPALQHPSLFYGDRQEQAYRAGRPVVPALTWIGSLGQPAAVPAALAAVSVAGVGALVAAAALLARSVGRDPSKAWLLLLVPGALASMAYLGLTDALATAAMVAALVLWRDDRVGWATALLALAVLTRETSLIAVAVIVVTYRPKGRYALLAIVPYAAWIFFVRASIGEWPFAASSDGARYTWPLVGLQRSIGGWGALEWVAFAVTAAVVIAGWRRLPSELRLFAAAWIGVGACLGWQVWARSFDFPRVLLPLGIVAGVTLLPRAPAPRADDATIRSRGLDPIVAP